MGSSGLKNQGKLHGEAAMSFGLRRSWMSIITEERHSLEERGQNRGSEAHESLTSLAEQVVRELGPWSLSQAARLLRPKTEAGARGWKSRMFLSGGGRLTWGQRGRNRINPIPTCQYGLHADTT